MMKDLFDNRTQEWNQFSLTEIEAAKEVSERRCEVELHLHSGEYVFKFKVNGECVLSEDWEKKADDAEFVAIEYLVAELQTFVEYFYGWFIIYCLI